MNKTEFAEYLADQMETTKAEAGRWLDAMIEGIHTGKKRRGHQAFWPWLVFT